MPLESADASHGASAATSTRTTAGAPSQTGERFGELDVRRIAAVARFSADAATRLPLSPRKGTSANPPPHEPRIAPSVFAAYADPTVRPTVSRLRTAMRVTSGNAAPMSAVGARRHAK